MSKVLGKDLHVWVSGCRCEAPDRFVHGTKPKIYSFCVHPTSSSWPSCSSLTAIWSSHSPSSSSITSQSLVHPSSFLSMTSLLESSAVQAVSSTSQLPPSCTAFQINLRSSLWLTRCLVPAEQQYLASAQLFCTLPMSWKSGFRRVAISSWQNSNIFREYNHMPTVLYCWIACWHLASIKVHSSTHTIKGTVKCN